MSIENKIAGALAGMAYGDAFGMPGELWPRAKVRERFGRITAFLDGPKDSSTACYYKAGQYTDDTGQALVILKDLLKYGRVPEVKVLAADLLEWVGSVNGFAINLLGPSSKAALLAHVRGEDYRPVVKTALTNGAAMRIAPVGCFFAADEIESLCRTVARVSCVTHGTDVTIAGAAMVAQMVASAINGRSWDEMLSDSCAAFDYARTLGEPTCSASIKRRLLNVISLLPSCNSDEDASELIYELAGTGTLASESVTAALAVAWYCRDPERAALMCANMGGDTDTMGAMACAICGAYTGISGIRAETIAYLEQVNDISFSELCADIMRVRPVFVKEQP